MAATLYSRDILRLAAAIPHLRRLAGAQASVEKASMVCGSRVIVDINVDESGRVVELGQQVSACALGQASAALMGEHAIGRSALEIAAARDALAGFLAGSRNDPGDWPGLDIFADARRFTARHSAILLAFAAAADASAQAVAGRD